MSRWGRPLNEVAGLRGRTRQCMGDQVDLLLRRDRSKSDQGALRTEQERLVDEIVVSSQVYALGACGLDGIADCGKPFAIKRRLFDRDGLGHAAQSLERFRLEDESP